MKPFNVFFLLYARDKNPSLIAVTPDRRDSPQALCRTVKARCARTWVTGHGWLVGHGGPCAWPWHTQDVLCMSVREVCGRQSKGHNIWKEL